MTVGNSSLAKGSAEGTDPSSNSKAGSTKLRTASTTTIESTDKSSIKTRSQAAADGSEKNSSVPVHSDKGLSNARTDSEIQPADSALSLTKASESKVRTGAAAPHQGAAAGKSSGGVVRSSSSKTGQISTANSKSVREADPPQTKKDILELHPVPVLQAASYAETARLGSASQASSAAVSGRPSPSPESPERKQKPVVSATAEKQLMLNQVRSELLKNGVSDKRPASQKQDSELLSVKRLLFKVCAPFWGA